MLQVTPLNVLRFFFYFRVFKCLFKDACKQTQVLPATITLKKIVQMNLKLEGKDEVL